MNDFNNKEEDKNQEVMIEGEGFVMSNPNQEEEKTVECEVVNQNTESDYEQPQSNTYNSFDMPQMNEKTEKKKSGRGKRFFKKSIALVSAAALFGVVASLSFQGISYLTKDHESAVGMKPIDELEDISENFHGGNIDNTETGNVVSTGNTPITATDVSGVVENTMPAIVAINCTATMTEYDFFGREYNREISGSGSGIIIGQNDSELLIVTNNHVVANATAVEIVFNDDSKALATIKGTEPSSDLAVVSVDMDDLSKETKNAIRIATLGNSQNIKTGEMAIAIGNALGYGQSVTVGYISALNREVNVDDITLNLIQTDAAINPGNSGGALLNTKGEIIGINSVKYADTQVEGIGYAIPISEAIPIINELMNRVELDEDEMAYLGIVGMDVEQNYANAFGMPVGVYVKEVAKDSAAEEAGLHKGDIITSFNGREVSTMSELMTKLRYTKGGTKVEITYKQQVNGEYVEKTVEVTLGFRK